MALSLGSLVLCKCFLIFLAHVSASFPRVPFLCTSPIPPPGSHARRASPLSFRIVLVLFLSCVLCATSALVLLCRPVHVRVSPQAVSAACLAEDPDLADRLFSAWLDRASFSQVLLTMNRKSATFGNGWSVSRRRDLRFSVVLLLFLASIPCSRGSSFRSYASGKVSSAAAVALPSTSCSRPSVSLGTSPSPRISRQLDQESYCPTRPRDFLPLCLFGFLSCKTSCPKRGCGAPFGYLCRRFSLRFSRRGKGKREFTEGCR